MSLTLIRLFENYVRSDWNNSKELWADSAKIRCHKLFSEKMSEIRQIVSGYDDLDY